MREMLLQGKHILVTGASSGIGRACAIHFSRSGAKVTLLARNEARLQETLSKMSGGGHIVIPYDLANIDGIEAMVDSVVKTQGKLDGLMYCAGDCYRYPLAVCKPPVVQASMQINYFAFVETLRCSAKKRNSSNGASFVCMSSDASLKGEKCLLTLGSSKAALNYTVRCAAKELAARKIRVNAISASYIGGSMIVQETRSMLGEDQVNRIIQEQQPLGEGQPQDIANMAAFLISEEARFITGTIMLVDGGYMA